MSQQQPIHDTSWGMAARWLVKAFIILHLWLWLAATDQRQQQAAARMEARITALEQRHPVDLHVTVARPEEAAQAVYDVLPQAGWTGR